MGIVRVPGNVRPWPRYDAPVGGAAALGGRPDRACMSTASLSRQTGGLVIDAVFVFDADGSRCAGTPGVDKAFGGRPIERVVDLAARFRQPDGMPLELELPGTRIALPAGVRGQMSAGRSFLWTITARNANGSTVAESSLQSFHILATSR